ncbi:bifunctional DNA-formamidopyrimidine glycosylase/DNA-(apurinic or apyrimidinic site) lyase [Aquabacterium sp. OR-4]|uniref:bifunctional DNA-formamidopyrimidine glycosylase/DNA-(apurinic or apyrimidinic site) lyase n=1 Tax=Aquabacterium sp. OR-4 TaxID=2978127 RepID=UPI0021B3D343|nr:bifunctional DNA-formamidopyrimidine glycosylase/DNA-(apurinic or apyrimidinic site) lyase [Aquabacterium sp. OR-4]MDT7837297.1 bifunctional DNA-formamidopyrimidine glycosylase/DNA-(apurinic or apyrimidinic site) lyase [Aquabacterium sp. OR-4]
MPELPEVEVTRASLADRLHGAHIEAVHLGKPLRWPLGAAPERLLECRIGELQRRGKYLWMPLTGPQAPGAGAAPREAGGLLWHLGMSGSLQLTEAPAARGVHDHVELRTSRGTLRLTDPRRFGAVVWSATLAVDPAARLLARLGAEPFDPALTPQRFHAELHARRTPVKAALLAGDIVVGAGNIYACEALHRAGIDPRLRCCQLSRPRAERLLAALRETLAQAIALGGSTLRDFKDAHGMSGAFQHQALVYGREGEACARCGGTVRRLVQAQRSTFFCPACQRR